MIDLRYKALPSVLHCAEGDFIIDTDFRVWIEFERMMREEQMPYYGVFDESQQKPLCGDWVKAAFEFLDNSIATPHGGKRSNERAIDLIQDGDYIVAAFMQAYGIDLTSVDYLHWHTFKALLRGLPDDTKLSQIMSMRTYSASESKKKHETLMAERKAAWKLPSGNDAEREKLLEWAEEIFRDEATDS